jgi:D-tyrosyl-tRNA(Tyr) deacylase
MRTVVQRVSQASVSVDGQVVGKIGNGLVILVAVGTNDSIQDLEFMKRKVSNLRIFNDNDGKINLSVKDTAGEILLISQFTLYGDCRKGNRPSFVRSATPDIAERTYLELAKSLENEGIKVEKGKFQAKMQVSLINDGPVTVIIDSNKKFY